jgi:prepilin signal peptidase PulO-like enzyme (type II secretory pathway)
METSTNPEVPIEWATPGATLLFLAFIMAAAALITMLLCRLQLTKQNRPSYWIGLLAALATALLTTLVCYEDYSGNLAYIVSGAAVPFLIFWVISLIPAVAVVRVYRKHHRHNQPGSSSLK